MLRSMTGFGSSLSENKNLIIKTEIKSLNSKFFDLKLKIPTKYQEKEIELRNYLENKLVRGKIDFNLYIKLSDASDLKRSINSELLKAYYKDISQISKELNLTEDNILDILLKLPDVLAQPITSDEVDPKEWKLIMNTIDNAIDHMDKFRLNEGKKLEKELRKFIEKISALCQDVEIQKDERIENINERIKSKFEELSEISVDETRLEQELIFYVEKLDISEELDRLKIHLEYFNKTLEEDHSGKKLGFISQEIGREINTIGAKANNSAIQHKVVLMKNELEKIKQQLANIL